MVLLRQLSSLTNVRSFTSCLLRSHTYVNGQWIKARSGDTFEVTNPANNSVIGTVPNLNVEDAAAAVDAAEAAFKTWGYETLAKERSAILLKWAELCVQNKDELAKILTAEMGKPLAEAGTEIMYGASYLEWYGQEARRINGEIIPTNTRGRQLLHYKEPVGVAALITPWNFPMALIARKVGAAFATGCTAVLKPAEDTPLSALALADLGEKAGLPHGVFNIITANRQHTASIGKFLCESPKIAALSFTGSTAVGKLLLQQTASTVKKLGLELGGNAPFIVFESADLDKAVLGVMASKFRAGGQTCVSSNRLFVQASIYDEFVEKLTSSIKNNVVVGNGFQQGVTLGPLINNRAVDKVDYLIKEAQDQGARLILGGTSHALGENFYEPTLICDVQPHMRICEEEIFGPVATVVKFDAEQQVLHMANSSRNGLAGYFYSQDLAQVFRVARHLEVGMVGVNEGIMSACEVAFGGVKESGLGREGSHYGLDDFLNVKYVCLGGLT